MPEGGKCEKKTCDKPAQVGLNGSWLCLDHFGERLKETRANIEKAWVR